MLPPVPGFDGAADVDVVVDSVREASTEGALAAVTGARSDPAHLVLVP